MFEQPFKMLKIIAV